MPLFTVPFLVENRFWVSFLVRSQIDVNFGVRFYKNNSLEYRIRSEFIYSICG